MQEPKGAQWTAVGVGCTRLENLGVYVVCGNIILAHYLGKSSHLAESPQVSLGGRRLHLVLTETRESMYYCFSPTASQQENEGISESRRAGCSCMRPCLFWSNKEMRKEFSSFQDAKNIGLYCSGWFLNQSGFED